MSRRGWAGAGVVALTSGVLGVAGGVAPVGMWLFALAVGAVGWWSARAGCRLVGAVVVLRRRGTVAEGRLESSRVESVEDALVTRHVYSYTDLSGERRTCTGTDTRGTPWAPILYDPADPDGTSQVGTRTAGMFVLGAVLLLMFGIPVLGGCAMAAGLAVSIAFA
ncbi:hypothetical protein SRB17_39090 [Streptomyces sp. RB17]|uniref:hypothetical protein n=1 Tax=Streptomyces sp. RB17 TaxID=2585197 RepID=UPI0012957266|nr:hypothetical protein [Streptomyces sp. RB17]MQY35913.1 hypothetical protein [Streptomyces sp. RB17]